MDNPPQPAPSGPESSPPKAGPAGFIAKALAGYNRLFPPDSPQRKYGPAAVGGALLIVLLLAKCAVSSAGDKISEVSKARAAAEHVRSTGTLVVKSNLAAAALKVAGTAGTVREGTINQSLAGLAPGSYTVTASREGWPEVRGEATIAAGQTAELTLNFPCGSLKLDTNPTGATVKLGKSNVLGKTPLTVPQLPVGDLTLSLEYPAWPAVPYTTAITENQETAATVRLPHGRLTVDSFPAGAIVVLDGKSYQKTPLFFDPVATGPKKLTIQLKDFPPLEVTTTVVDAQDTRIRPVLANAFPVLDPAELLRAVWIDDNPSQVAPALNQSTGIYRPKNDIVKNIQRERLYNRWQHKSYRFSGAVKSYDAASGKLEFTEQKSELARYRVVVQLKPGTPSPLPAQKDPKDKTPVVVGVYGRLTAVEEPPWPLRVFTLELTNAEFLPEEAP